MPNAEQCILNSYKLYFPTTNNTAIDAGKVKKLQLNNCDINDIGFFLNSTFTALEELHLCNNKIVDISPLSKAKLPNLSSINLLNNFIVMTEPLIEIEKNTCLNRLNLMGNLIETCKYLLILAKKGVRVCAIKNPIADKQLYSSEIAQDKTLEQFLKIDNH
jgi:Leucine-rich repeat (LRR) protein